MRNEESHLKRLKHLEEFDENLPEDLRKAEEINGDRTSR